jgi:RecJ-like exonuclease
MIPGLFLLLIIPIALNYLSQKEYAELEPEYERSAKNVRIRMINESMIGSIVRIEGVIERTYFQFLNRPQFLVADRTGEISVKMFTSPREDVKQGDVVEVLGMIIRRYVATGDPVINCVAIRKLEKKMDIRKKE